MVVGVGAGVAAVAAGGVPAPGVVPDAVGVAAGMAGVRTVLSGTAGTVDTAGAGGVASPAWETGGFSSGQCMTMVVVVVPAETGGFVDEASVVVVVAGFFGVTVSQVPEAQEKTAKAPTTRAISLAGYPARPRTVPCAFPPAWHTTRQPVWHSVHTRARGDSRKCSQKFFGKRARKRLRNILTSRGGGPLPVATQAGARRNLATVSMCPV